MRDYETELNALYESLSDQFDRQGMRQEYDQLLEFTYYGEYKVGLEMLASMVRIKKISIPSHLVASYVDLCDAMTTNPFLTDSNLGA